jgi:HipA-like protein
MIKVWTDGAEAGLLDRSGQRGTTFLYQPGAPEPRAVSVTMPVRLASWDISYGIAPIFEMNLPEGVLRERLRLAFAKAIGTFDDYDLLGIVGRSQVGRIATPDTKNPSIRRYPSSPWTKSSLVDAKVIYSITSWTSSLPSRASVACNQSS